MAPPGRERASGAAPTPTAPSDRACRTSRGTSLLPLCGRHCATESNCRAEHYCRRYGEPGSEAVDARMVPDWAQSRCPSCGALHRVVVRAFPPGSSIKPLIRKAIAEAGASGAPLAQASVPRAKPAADGFV